MDNLQIYKFFEPTQDVVKVLCYRELIYIAHPYEIIVLSLRRLLKRKDIIKKKISIPIFRTVDPLTSAFNDNQQMNFVALAYKDDRYPILHSSNVEKRLITLNSEQPQIKDFYNIANSLIILCNNGALIKDQQLLYEGVKAVAVWDGKLAVYTEQLIINNLSVQLQKLYKDEVKYSHNFAVLYNQQELLITQESGLQKTIQFSGALQIEIIDGDVLYILKHGGIYIMKIGSGEVSMKLELDFLSKFYLITGNDDILFKNGQTFIGQKWRKISGILSVCTSHNQAVEFICQKEMVGESLNCLIIEKKSLDTLKHMLRPLLEHNFTVPLDLCDFKIYFHYINDQINVLKLAKQLYDKKKKVVDLEFHQYRPDLLYRATGAVILSVLGEMEQKQLYKEFYIHRYINFLDSIKPTSDKIRFQISLLDKSHKPPTNFQFNDICPVCQDQLISWTACQQHRFMRCSVTLVPLYQQAISVCKNCELQIIENIMFCPVCPVCCCEMRVLRKV